MSGYSRDIERQNKALQTILDGGTPEKRIFIAKEDLEYKQLTIQFVMLGMIIPTQYQVLLEAH